MTIIGLNRGVSTAIAGYGEGYEQGFLCTPTITPTFLMGQFEEQQFARGRRHGESDRLLHRPSGTSFKPPTEADLEAFELRRKQEARNSHVRGDY